MKSALAAALAVALAACSAHTQIQATGVGGAPGAIPPGTSVTSGSAGLQIQGGGASVAAALIAIGLLAGSDAWVAPERRVPELAPDRRVKEQDCTKPLEDASANLRCR